MRAAAVLVSLLLAASGVSAQAPPTLNVVAPPELAAARGRVERFDTAPLAAIAGLLGLQAPGPPISVRLATDSDPWASRVPPWTAGLALGAEGLIVLFPSRSPVYPHDTLEDVLRHEVTHVLIDRAAGGGAVPRWFHEGVATAVERPWGLEDRTRLASALVFGPRLDVASIDALFGRGEGEQSRAYALSAAIVRHLMATHGDDVPGRVLAAMARGTSFDAALQAVTGQPRGALEASFWDAQRTWTTWVPIVASSSIVWLVTIGLAGIALKRRRERSRRLRATWVAEDRSPVDASSLSSIETPDRDE